MKLFLRNILFVFALMISFSVRADVGETFTLKQKRSELIQERERLLADTSKAGWSVSRVENLNKEILALDAQIFSSYDETVSRMASQKIADESNSKMAVYLALGTTFAALFLAFLLIVARTRILGNGQAGIRQLYRELTMDFVSQVSPEKADAQRMLRVNLVVVIGLVMMSVSVLAYLLSAL